MDDDVQFIKPLNTLTKAKTGNGPAKLDMKKLAEADAVVEEMTQDYIEWAREDLSGMEAAVEQLKGATGDQKKILGRLRTFALDMKGQGGTFDYSLITEIGDSLDKFLDDLQQANALDIKVIDKHVESIKLVLFQDIRSDGGPNGQELIQELIGLREKASR